MASSKWHYQILKHVSLVWDEEEVWYGLHPCVEENDGPTYGEPVLTGDSLQEIKDELKEMQQSIRKYGILKTEGYT